MPDGRPPKPLSPTGLLSGEPRSAPDSPERRRERSGSSCGVLGAAAQSILSGGSRASTPASNSRGSSARASAVSISVNGAAYDGCRRKSFESTSPASTSVFARADAVSECDSVTQLLVALQDPAQSKPPKSPHSDMAGEPPLLPVAPRASTEPEMSISRRRLAAPKSGFTNGKKIRTIDNAIHDMLEDDRKCTQIRHPAQEITTPGSMCSIWGSSTTAKDSYIPFFGDKPMNFDGELSEKIPHYIGLLCHRGHKPNSPNQDNYFVLAREGMLLFGVLDGHGHDGHEISDFGRQHLPKYFIERLLLDREPWESIAKSSFEALSKRLLTDMGTGKADASGSTVTICMLDGAVKASAGTAAGASAGTSGPDDAAIVSGAASAVPLRLRCAFVGDSSSVYAKRVKGSRSWEVTLLTDIHKPDRPDELERIEACGGSVQANPHRPDAPQRFVCGDYRLSMSRALGDLHFATCGLSHEPETTPEIEMANDYEHLILTASDGIWDMVPPAQAVQLVGKFKPEEAQLAVEKLVAKATLRWQEKEGHVDDVTCILVFPQFDA